MFYQLSSYIKKLFKTFLPIGRSFGNSRVQGFYGRLLGPVSDHVLINRTSKERTLHQVIKYCHGTI